MSYLIADLDGTIVKSVTGQRSVDWSLNVPIDFLKQFKKIFIVTNQADNRVNLRYINNIKKLLHSYKLDVTIIINKKRDAYRKPHVMSFLEYIKKFLTKKDNVTWIGDQISDYYYYCNCLLHLSGYNGKYLYYDIKNFNIAIEPSFIKDDFKNDHITFLSDKHYIVYTYLLDMKSVFLNMYKGFQIIKTLQKYYVLEHKEKNITIYLGHVPEKKNIYARYILNSAIDTERIARYYQYVHFSTYVKKYLYQFHEKYKDVSIIKLYPNINVESDKLFFLEKF